jgi:hypothetical protein
MMMKQDEMLRHRANFELIKIYPREIHKNTVCHLIVGVKELHLFHFTIVINVLSGIFVHVTFRDIYLRLDLNENQLFSSNSSIFVVG